MDKNIEPEEISVKQLVQKMQDVIRYIKSKWKIILVGIIIGAILGFSYSIFKKPTYQAVSTFVLEDGSKGGGLGQYAGLASLAGVDIGGSMGNSGIFQGDNILELYKSRTMLEKTLLSTVNINGKQQMLIDRYIDFNKLRSKWQDNKDLKNISFSDKPEKFSRTQDSIVTNIVELFNKKLLSVSKIDKKLSIIRVEVSSKDELFARAFNIKLVEKVNDFYSQTKTKKSNQNIQVLQHQADSVRQVLNNSIGGVASAMDASPNANPALLVLKVASQRKQVDVQASTAIYGEIVKNLELTRLSLRQETPLIQIIDQPVLPLDNDKLSKIKGTILGGILCALAVVFGLLLTKVFRGMAG